jgi:hypothetical protein
VHLELSLGAYMMKRPEVNLYFNVGSDAVVDHILDNLGGIDADTRAKIIDALNASGGNILNLPEILVNFWI